MRYKYPLVGLLLVCAMLLVSCATSAPGKLYQAGAYSKLGAEDAYQLIYIAHTKTIVSKTDMDKADDAYDTWLVAQANYIKLARQGLPTNDPVKVSEIALQVLLDLTKAYGLSKEGI